MGVFVLLVLEVFWFALVWFDFFLLNLLTTWRNNTIFNLIIQEQGTRVARDQPFLNSHWVQFGEKNSSFFLDMVVLLDWKTSFLFCFYFLLLCVYICTHVCVCALCMHSCKCMCTCSQRSISVAFLNWSTPCFLRQGILLNQKLANSTRIKDQQAPGILLSLVPQYWEYRCTWLAQFFFFFHIGARDQTQVILKWHTFQWLGYLSNLPSFTLHFKTSKRVHQSIRATTLINWEKKGPPLPSINYKKK